MNCIFCDIIAGAIPCKKAYEDDLVLAFFDIAPAAPVHILVVPKEHIDGAAAITADNADIVAHIFSVIPKIAAEQGLTAFRVVTNNGEDAGQSVFHLHFHLLGGRTMKSMG